MVYRVRVLVTKPEDISWVPRTHRLEGKTDYDLHIQDVTNTGSCTSCVNN